MKRSKADDLPAKVEILPPAGLDATGTSVPEAATIVEAVEILPPEAEPSEPLPPRDIPDIDGDDTTPSAPASASRELVPLDPLTLYLKEISKIAPLNRDEEHALAVAFRDNKDRSAAARLISANLWLVVKIAREYERAARNLLDLIQEGNIGLLEAINNFDPYRGVRFPSYAAWWVRAYIVRFVIANWRLVKIGTTQAQRKLFFNLKKEKERLEREGFFPAPKLLAERLDVKEGEIVEMEQRLAGSDLSVDAPLQDDSESNLLGILASTTPDAEQILASQEIRARMHEALVAFAETLNEKERLIYNERLLKEDKAILNDIAEKLGISRERVRQIELRVKEKLKTYLTERLGDEIPGNE